MIGRRSFLSLAASLGASALGGCGSNNTADFRYRLSFTVDVDGEEKTASSIINVHFYGIGSHSPEAFGRGYYSRVQGVAPVMDLGPGRGWLAAALGRGAGSGRQAFPRICAAAVDAIDIAWMFGNETSDLPKLLLELPKLTKGEILLQDRQYPSFIWFPPNASYTEAKILCPVEFTRFILANVRLRSVTAEVTPGAPLLKRLEVQAPWLEQLRSDQTEGWPGYNSPKIPKDQAGEGFFRVDLTAQLETDRS